MPRLAKGFRMPKEEWGLKHICASVDCGTRFYDLNRDPIACPKCGLHVENQETLQSGEASKAGKREKGRDSGSNSIAGDSDVLVDDGDDGTVLDETVLDDDDDDTVSLDEIADMPEKDDES